MYGIFTDILAIFLMVNVYIGKYISYIEHLGMQTHFGLINFEAKSWSFVFLGWDPKRSVYGDRNAGLIKGNQSQMRHVWNIPWKMNGWNLQPSLMKRKEHDLPKLHDFVPY